MDSGNSPIPEESPLEDITSENMTPLEGLSPKDPQQVR